MKKTSFQQKDEFTEAEALIFWLEWVNTHPEHEFMVMRNIMAIQKNLQENWNASHPETKIDYKLFPEPKSDLETAERLLSCTVCLKRDTCQLRRMSYKKRKDVTILNNRNWYNWL